MHLLKATKVSCKLLLGNSLRSAICATAILVGVGSAIMAAGASRSGRAELREQLGVFGERLVVVSAARARSPGRQDLMANRYETLGRHDLNEIRRSIPDVVRHSGVVTGNADAHFGGRSAAARILGVEGSYFLMQQIQLGSGRLWMRNEEEGVERVAVIGYQLGQELFVDQQATGQWIRIGDAPFRVIGVAKPRGRGLAGEDRDNTIYLPLGTAMKRVIRQNHLNNVFLQVQDDESLETVPDRLARVLRRSHRIPAGNPDDFTVQVPAVLVKMELRSRRVFEVFAGAISVVALMSGFVALTIVMSMAVRERTREIGLRRAFGATRRDILVQFLVESLLLSFLGASAGLVLGVLTYLLTCHLLEWHTNVPTIEAITAWAGATVLGIAFGSYAATRAARSAPASAVSGYAN